jgi:hypothetical protein
LLTLVIVFLKVHKYPIFLRKPESKKWGKMVIRSVHCFDPVSEESGNMGEPIFWRQKDKKSIRNQEP